MHIARSKNNGKALALAALAASLLVISGHMFFQRDAGRRTGIKPDGTEEQIIRILKEHEAGVPVADLSAASTASATPA